MTAYNLKNFMKAVRDPKMVIGLLNEWGEKTNQWYSSRFTPNQGRYVMDADWDNLVILDACRYDLFETHNFIEGEYQRVRSRGGTSEEFFQENFAGRKYGDTVYVSANPFVEGYTDSFHDVLHLYADNHWDDSVKTVRPEVVAATARESKPRYPNKRHIIHFMQPHLPPLGDIRNEFGILPGVTNSDDSQRSAATNGTEHLGYLASLRFGQNGITPSLIRRAHEENLEIVLDVVNDLLDDLSGKSVITADHGDLYGERLRPVPTRGYLHRWYLRHEKLITVPWLEIDAKTRPKISDDDVGHSGIDSGVVTDRLESLGYM